MPNDFSSFSQKSFLTGSSFLNTSPRGVIRLALLLQRGNIRKLEEIAGHEILTRISNPLYRGITKRLQHDS
jgi:hypothetical protein